MKTHLKLVALMLAAFLVLGLASACTGGGTSGSEVTATPAASSGSSSGNSASSSSSSGSSASSGSTETAEPAEEPYTFKLPIVDDTTTLSVWRSWGSDGLNITDPSVIAANVWLAEQTNINIEWVAASSTNANEQFNLMIASLDYQDMIAASTSTYIGGVDKGIEDEVYIDATPYIEKFMPNYAALRNANERVLKDTTTDSGKNFISSILDDDLFVWRGPMVRQDWLDDLGYGTIETYDQLHSFLTDVKEQKGISNSLLYAINMDKGSYGMIGGFGTTYEFMQKNGTVLFGPTMDEYREYLETMAQWFKEGLIWSDFPNDAQMMVSAIQLHGAGNLAYDCNDYYGGPDVLPAMAGGVGKVTTTPYLSRTAGEKNHLRLSLARASTGTSIFVTTAAVERGVEELCYKWIDSRFSEEIFLTLNLGIQGKDWDYDASGDPAISQDFIDHEIEQGRYGFERTDRTLACRDLAVRDYLNAKTKGTEWLIDLCNVWSDSADDAWVMPTVSLTADEAAEYSKYYTDISTYVEEFSTGVIVGNQVLDDTVWQNYINQLNSMNIARVVEIEQTALNRYNAR